MREKKREKRESSVTGKNSESKNWFVLQRIGLGERLNNDE